ncbi:MAG: serine protease [Candidatus Korobacteraceae bacterium]
MRRLALVTFVMLTSLSWNALGQDAVPTEILERTIFIKAGNEEGTAFTVDYQGKMYLLTARHVVAGLPTTNATIQVWQDEHWKEYKTVKTIFPASSDVDIAVFETSEKVPTPYEIKPQDTSGVVTMGQQVWFLGYPFGIASHFQGGKRAPFMKRGTMSAIDATSPDAVVIYIDGFNNPGFSGGPIVFWDFSKHAYEILGVVQGYKEDSAKILINGQHVNTQLLVNTGILAGYSIKHAMDAIAEIKKQPQH